MTVTYPSGRYQLVLDGIHSKRYLDDLPPTIRLPIKPKIAGGAGGLMIRGPVDGTEYRLVGSSDGEARYESVVE